MATLEKIRSKSALLLIIIGVALLAFIIGDFFNSSRSLFGPDHSVASIDGKKVEAQEFQAQLEKVNQGNSSNSDEDRAYFNQNVLRQMLLNRLQTEEYERLGLTVTDDELNDAINGENTMLADYITMQLTGGQMQSAAQFRDFCFNPAKYGNTQADSRQFQEAWISLENQVEQALLERKFANMLSGTMVANKLDIQQIFNDANTGYEIAFAKKIATPDRKDSVSVDDLKKEWEAHKSFYRLSEESRLIGVITVPIVPSVTDEETARKEVSEVLAGLNTTPDLDALRGRKGFDSNRFTITTSALNKEVARGGDAKLKQFADSANVGSAIMLQDGPTDFVMAKLLGRTVVTDTITVNFVLFPTEDNAKADSILAAVKAGSKAEALRDIDPDLFAVDSLKISLSNPQLPDQLAQLIGGDIQAYKESFLNAELGQAFTPDSTTTQVARYYTVVSRKAPESTVELAFVNYTLHPSSATINDLRSKLEQYIAKNDNAKAFADNAATANYNFNLYDVTASSPYVQLGNSQQGPVFLPNSHAAAVWALDAKKGEVSKIFGDERTGSFMVAALENVFTDYITIEHPTIKSTLTQKIRQDKAAEKAMAELKGKGTNVETYAAAMGVEPGTDVVNFYNSIYTYGPDALAKITTTPKGTFVAPTKTNDGVIVYQVTAINAPARAINLKNDEALFQQRRGIGMLQNGDTFFRMLLGDRKYTNRLAKVFNSAN